MREDESWRSTSTAPTDGRTIKLKCGKDGEFVTKGEFYNGMWCGLESGVRLSLPLGPAYQPTHWMPC